MTRETLVTRSDWYPFVCVLATATSGGCEDRTMASSDEGGRPQDTHDASPTTPGATTGIGGGGGGGGGGDVGEGRDDAGPDGIDSNGGSDGEKDAGPATLLLPWDWAGVVGTGQSLAVGQMGTPVEAKTQPYHNLKLSTGNAAWPLDPNSPSFVMVPLIEPIGRPSRAYPSSYPTNIAGETPHTAMADQITAMVMAVSGGDYVNVHGEFGENGQCMTYLRKGAPQSGVNGHAYEATLMEARAITRLAKASNKTYGIGAIIVTHGECDAGNSSYESELFKLSSDYNADLPIITGQSQKIQMIVSQQNSSNDRAASTLAQWRVGVSHPAEIVCSGPKYQYPYFSDHLHLTTAGYERLGEKYGQIYFERVVMGRDWQPLQPTQVERNGRLISVHFHVPVLPLVWDTLLPLPQQSSLAWREGKGFEVRAGNSNVTISTVEIVADTVRITCASDLPPTGVVVGYAMQAGGPNAAQVKDASGTLLWTGTVRWGQLRDSDPFRGATTMMVQPNYSVAFEIPVP